MTYLKTITQRLFGRTVVDSLDLNQNAWYIDEEQVTVTAAQINQLATTKFVTASTLGADVAGKGLAGGNGAAIRLDTSVFHSLLAAGTAKNTSVTVAGITAADTIVSVFLADFTGGSITDVTSEYTAGAGVMTKVGPDEAGKTLMINWVKAS